MFSEVQPAGHGMLIQALRDLFHPRSSSVPVPDESFELERIRWNMEREAARMEAGPEGHTRLMNGDL